MKLEVILPSGVLLLQEVLKIVAEGMEGSFCLLPRHRDIVVPLVPGILAFVPAGGSETFLAIDEGVLVKRGPEVHIATWNAVGGSLGDLKHAVRKQLREISEHEQRARAALGKLEASLVHQILEWKQGGRG